MKVNNPSTNGPDHLSSPDDIVITGMSGSFSGSHNIEELEYKLYNKIDLVTKETRFEFTYMGQPERGGIIPETNKFDSGFFGVHGRQSEFMDPLIRMFLEKCTEAIFDAGLHPEDLENTRTGVYVGTCVSETQIYSARKPRSAKSFFWTGTTSNMISNRISYFFKLNGPSFTTDTACSSSLYALEHAYSALRSGEIDMAIVGGSNLCVFAGTTIQFARLGVLNLDGACKVFDEKANGYVRAEGICALLLQKNKSAKRIYCTVVHAKTNSDGYKDEGITHPSGEAQCELLSEFYNECGISPHHLSFLEAHGTGTTVGDPEECDAIDQIFTKNRDKPLLIGSVKSSVGHSEPVSGCISIVKSILALEKGEISPNIHFNSPNPKIAAIVEGRLKVVTDVTKFQDDRALIGINSFGFGGGNSHVLLRGNKKPKQNNGLPSDGLPRLVCLSGRTPESIRVLCNYIAEIGVDAEFIGLLHNIFRKNIANHIYRGYIIMSENGIVDQVVNSERFATWSVPSINVVFGEFDNWYLLLQNFRDVHTFKDTLGRIENILLPMNLEGTILSANSEIRTSFNILGNVIAQICIADLLKTLKIPLNLTTGYSFGELVCAYCDEALELEEVLQCAYIFNTEFVRPGQNDKNIINGTPNHIADKNEESPLKKDLVKKLSNVLKKPSNWKGQWASAEYFTDVVLKSSAKKSETFIKSNTVILEVGKNNIEINKDGNENTHWLTIPETLTDFLKTLGRLYQLGFNPAIENVYPAIKFPVSRGTPRLSSKIKWMHHKSYLFRHIPTAHEYRKLFTIDLRKSEWSYITGHMIDGRVLFPATGYLFLTWDTFAEKYKVQDSLPVIFENVRLIRATTILPSNPVTFVIVINNSGYFEVTEKDSLVVTGHIKEVLDEDKEFHKFQKLGGGNHLMSTKDIYQELRLRGYNYNGQFRAMKSCDINGCAANIEWIQNYVTFIDNLLQLQILSHDSRLLYVPTHIYKLTILPKMHCKAVKQFKKTQQDIVTLPAYFNPQNNVLRSGGIEAQGILASPIPRRKILSIPVLESYEFVPNETEVSKQLSARINAQIIAENSSVTKSFPSLEILDPTDSTEPESLLLTPALMEAIGDMPLVQAEAKVFSNAQLTLTDVTVVNNGNLRAEAKLYILIIGSRLLQKKEVLDDVLYAVRDNGYIISREPKDFTAEDLKNPDLVLLTVHRTEDETIIMMSKSNIMIPVLTKIDDDPEFSWLPKLQPILKTNKDVVLYSEHNALSGITGFINCLKKEPEIKNVRAVFIMDEDKSFCSNEQTFVDQLRKNLTVNIYKNGQWGTYRHLPITPNQEIECQHIFLSQIATGDLSSLRWIEGPLSGVDSVELNIVEIHYSALNFKDIMIASGKLSADSVGGYDRCQITNLGMEYTGVNQFGKRLMGMAMVGAIATRIEAKNAISWEIPDEWRMEDAVTIPVIYATMIYGVFMRGNLKKGESILIHSGVGGVGQAAIRYCLFHGMTVFATVGSEQRKEVLQKLFPELPENHIGNSHDTSFEQMIMKETKGRGVDMVLNSLAEEKLLSSVRCLAQGGRMIEIGKYDIQSNTMLSLLLLKKQASFHGVMLDMLLSFENADLNKLSKLIYQGLKEGSIKPINRNVFKLNEIEQAFRFMAGGKHLGKVVIQIREEGKAIDYPKLQAERYPGIRRFYCDPKKSYVIIGGLGGFGLELADWLILRGARKLLLSSSRGFTNGYQRMRIRAWENYGAVIHVTTVDLSKESGCAQLIQEAQKLGPIDGIFNLAVCLKDALFENQTVDMYKASLMPKAYVTKHLDKLTRHMCPDLRNFVVFSSVSCGKGNAGQTNYGMANSIMERICEARRRDGYPGKAIQWGAIGEVGILGEMMENNAVDINIGGTLLQKISSCLQVFDSLLTHPSPIVSSIVVAEKTRGSYSTENVVEAVASILGITDLKSVSLHSTLSEIGMDSMTAVEIKQVLEQEFDIFVSPKEMRTMTFAKLQEIQDAKDSGQTATEKPVDLDEVKFMIFEKVVDETESQILSIPMDSKAELANSKTILIIPGLEGFVKNLEPICQNLEAQVYGLQFNHTEAPDTIFDMAQSKVKLAEEYLSKDTPFEMIAYSYGVVEALELVAILESKGYVGTVYCIDGAPTVMNKFSNAIGKTGDEIETNTLLRLLAAYKAPLSGLQKMALDYQKCKNLDEKVDKTLEEYGTLLPLSNEYVRRLIRGTVKRVLAISVYSPSYTTLKSRLVLFKPSVPSFTHQFEDFGLGAICGKSVPIHTIEGNHSSILLNEDIPKYINSYL